MFSGIRRLAGPALATLLLAAPLLQARPPHKQALADYFGPFLAPHLNDCRTCHLRDKPGVAGNDLPREKPHNPFGARLKAVKSELRQAGKPTTIAARLEAIADEDSDADGVSNLIEILTGHYPGDPSDKPTAAEVANAQETLAAFRKFKSAYPWTPFETVKRPAVPGVRNPTWVRNPIDAFIAAVHEEQGLKPRPEAAKVILLRRVYLDLIGLPPTPEEVHAFIEDPSPTAYEKVVDRLLNSPHYGERWGRHWMDIWRYSDWAGWGSQVRDSQPHIWHWRDWIVESLNQDKGYDRMILEMLAADELSPLDTDALRATGYLVRNFKLLSREKWLEDTVDHTAQAFVGVTLGCARCHDHMYDPILQKEYYQVRAIFEPHQVRIDRLRGQPDTTRAGLPRAYDADPEVKTFLFIRGDDRNPDKTPVPPGVPEALGGTFAKIDPVGLPSGAHSPDKRDFVIAETLAASASAVAKARSTLTAGSQAAAQALAQALLDGEPLRILTSLYSCAKTLDAFAVAEGDVPVAEAKLEELRASIHAEELEDAGKQDSEEWRKAATETALWQRKLAVLRARRNLLAAQQAQRGAPAKTKAESSKNVSDAEAALTKAEADAKLPPSTAYTKRTLRTYPKISTGRRLAFARWIADRENPLTARVAVNHIWLRHFGQAIVPTVYNFGRSGQPPSHPALLDWLAAELMECGWSMKTMHRLIVTSNAYRMASTPDSANLDIDRDDKYLWRMPSRRVEAEVVRDSVFSVAGKLDLTMGGPDIDQTQGLAIPRRSIYFRHAVEKQMEFLKIFDSASVSECYQRKESIMPQQALALVNSELTVTQARLLARRLAGKVGSEPTAFTTAAFESVLCRAPTEHETAECLRFLQEQTRRYSEGRASAASPAVEESEARARANLVHVLLNHNDFLTVR